MNIKSLTYADLKQFQLAETCKKEIANTLVVEPWEQVPFSLVVRFASCLLDTHNLQDLQELAYLLALATVANKFHLVSIANFNIDIAEDGLVSIVALYTIE